MALPDRDRGEQSRQGGCDEAPAVVPEVHVASYVQDFSEGGMDQKDLLGGKGANLAEMTRLGLPVPPGFTITTDACRAYMRTGHLPPELRVQVTMAVRRLEDALGRGLGDFHEPLLVSVRSGAKFSMPGMMETVLNVGLNDASVIGLAELAGDERFAWDSYRRLIQMFGKTVLDIDGDLFADTLDKAKAAKGVEQDVDLDAADLRQLVEAYKEIVRSESGRVFPQHPREQLDMAIVAVFDSWGTERARLYRRKERIPDDLGTAVNVCTMVFGNLGPTSGTGVAFTRDPASGRTGEFGDYLVNAQGEDVVAGIRNTLSLADLEEVDPAAHAELMQAMRRLETHYRDLCDIEFTIERGKLWMLQTRVGKRTAPAAFRIACQLVDEHLITMDEALSRVTGAQLSQLQFPQFGVDDGERVLLTKAMPASPGAAVGMAVFDPETAEQWASEGKDVILVRRETNPDDLGGMIASVGVLTARGGKTSHAAVVARGMGRTCVVGAEELVIDQATRSFTSRGHTVHEGDVIAIDGTTGEVYLGEVPVVPSPVQRYLEDGLEVALEEAEDDETRDLVRAVDRILRHADAARRLRVHANADTAEDAVRARHLGAQGIGLCRTEHMFLGERRVLVERVILAADDDERQAALDALLPLQRQDLPTCSPRWTGCRRRSGSSTRRCTSSSPTSPSCRSRSRWTRSAGTSTSATSRCWPRSAACTRRTPCSACAVSGSGSSSPGSSTSRSARSARRSPHGSPRADTRTPRSWCRSSGRSRRCVSSATGPWRSWPG